MVSRYGHDSGITVCCDSSSSESEDTVLRSHWLFEFVSGMVRVSSSQVPWVERVPPESKLSHVSWLVTSSSFHPDSTYDLSSWTVRVTVSSSSSILTRRTTSLLGR